jgi:hypothetical protein
MSEDSSPQLPMATWNPARGVWETQAVSLFCGHSELYSATWPASGSMRNGRSFERPMSVPPTSGNEPSSSPGLPTPRARDGRGRGYEDGLPNVVQLLPTPTTSEATGGAHAPGKQGGKSLRATLLPTPRASDGAHGGPNQRGSKGDLALPAVAAHLLPTPVAADGQRESATYSRGNPTLKGALLPTPRVTATRTGRSAILNSGSSPSLDQAIELAQGILPRELTDLCEAPASWHGASTSPLSDAGNTPSDDPRPQQLTIETA